MPDKPHRRNSDEDGMLNELIRACRDKELSDRFVRPDGDAINAYLMGIVTEEQEKAVKSALAQSKQFRREILNMAPDMDALASSELLAEKEGLGKIPVPDRQEFLKRYGELTATAVAEPVSLLVRVKRFWGRLMELRIPQVLAPAVVAAAVLLFVIIQTGVLGPGRTWSLVQENMEQGLLISNITRAAESRKAYSTPELAALAKIRFLLKFEGGQFHLNPVSERPQPSSPARGLLLLLVDSNANIIQEFREHVPATEAALSEPVMAWALGLPPRNLYTIKMRSDSMQVKWIESMGSYGCITFTYGDEDGYRATAGSTFDLR